MDFLTDDERAALNSSATPEPVRRGLYVKSLREAASCYERAADAPGLRRDAARFLRSEAERLTREARGYETIVGA